METLFLLHLNLLHLQSSPAFIDLTILKKQCYYPYTTMMVTDKMIRNNFTIISLGMIRNIDENMYISPFRSECKYTLYKGRWRCNISLFKRNTVALGDIEIEMQ